MGRRTSKKSEKITLDEIYPPPHNIFERNYENIQHYPRSGRYIPPIQQVTLVKITGQCSMCEQILHKEFPDDFPNEWKFCCFCKMVADYLIKIQAHKNLILLSYKFQKILKKITVVGE